MILSVAEFSRALATYERTAHRLELQPAYLVSSERESVARFLSGQQPILPTDVPSYAAWLGQVAEQTAAGRRMARVRVHDDPPTGYQRWERWAGQWNARAGEHLRYMTPARAREVGLLPAAGPNDWWLLDDERLIIMTHTPTGQTISRELVTDPDKVTQARMWWDLAVQHSALDDDAQGAATAA